jgi:hypothetical protein
MRDRDVWMESSLIRACAAVRSASLLAGGASILEKDILDVSSIGWKSIRAINDPAYNVSGTE